MAKETISFIHDITDELITVKNVLLGGRKHAKLVHLSKPNTISHPVPEGYRLDFTKTGLATFRPKKQYFECDEISVYKEYESPVITGMEPEPILKKKLRELERVTTYEYPNYNFDGRFSETLTWRKINYGEPLEFLMSMGSYQSFCNLSQPEEEFNDEPAFVFYVTYVDDFLPSQDTLLSFGADTEDEAIKLYKLKQARRANRLQTKIPSRYENFSQLMVEQIIGTAGREFVELIRDITRSGPACLIVCPKSNIKLNVIVNVLEPIFYKTPLEIYVGDGQPLMNTKLHDIEIKPSTKFSDLFIPQNVGPKNACLFTAVWNVLRDDKRYQERNKTTFTELSKNPYFFMWKICFGDKPFTGEFKKMKLKEGIPLFDFFGKNLKVFDANSSLWYHYSPKKIIDSNYKTISLIVHCQHVHVCNKVKRIVSYTNSRKYNIETGEVVNDLQQNKKDREQSSLIGYSILSEEENPNYEERPEGEDTKTAPICYVEDTFDMNNIRYQKAIDTIAVYLSENSQYSSFTFYTNKGMVETFKDIYKAGYKPTVVSSKSKAWAGLIINNFVIAKKEILIRIKKVPDILWGHICNLNINEKTNYLRKYFYEDRNVKARILNVNSLSNYSRETYKIYTHYKRGGRVGCLIDKKRWDNIWRRKPFVGLDISKFYTSILCSFTQLQVLCMFDNFLPYDDHPLELFTTYEVEFFERGYTNEKISLCLGKNLITWLSDQPSSPDEKCDKIRILSYVRPSKIAPNHIPKIIEQLWKSDVELSLKKNISNTLSGCFGMDKAYFMNCQTFSDSEEAQHYMGFLNKNNREYTTTETKYPAFDLNNNSMTPTIITLIERIGIDYYSGFLPIYHMMIDTADLLMLQLENKIRDAGIEVIGRHTDNIYVNAEYMTTAFLKELREKFKDDICPESEFLWGLSMNDEFIYGFDSSTFESIGKIKPEKKFLGEKYHELVVTPREKYICPEKEEINLLHYARYFDEWDEHYLIELLSNQKFCYISAKWAGCGKTQLAVNFIKKFELVEYKFDVKKKDLKVLIMSFQNEKVCQLKKDFEDYPYPENVVIKTIDSFFPYQNDLLKKAYNDIKKFDWVIVDEFDNTPLPTLQKMMRCVDYKLIQRFFITSDINQLVGINPGMNNISDSNKMYDNIKKKYFPTQLKLSKIKRARCEDHVQKFTLEDIKICKECERKRDYAEKVYEAILYSDNDREAREFVRELFPKVFSLDEIGNENNISYFRDSKAMINEFCHKRISERKNYVGQKLICVKPFKVKGDAFYRNFVVSVTEVNNPSKMINQKKTPTKITIFEPFSKKSFVFDQRELNAHFKLSHAVTCHSKQGSSIVGNTYIFDTNSWRATKNWLYVAISRNVDVKKNFIYLGNELKAMAVSKKKEKISEAIKGLKKKDDKECVKYNLHEYVNSDWINEMIQDTEICPNCETTITVDNFKLSKKDNNFGYMKHNVVFLCKKC